MWYALLLCGMHIAFVHGKLSWDLSFSVTDNSVESKSQEKLNKKQHTHS